MKPVFRPALPRLLPLSCIVAALTTAGCGGGGNESGMSEDLIASPTSVDTEGPPGQCATGQGPTVYIYGGQPPYTLKNTVPLAVSLDTTKVTGSGRGFTITYINGTCFTDMPIVIEDDAGRILNVPLSNTAGPSDG